ncbi:MAG: hypothetical protein ACHQSE_16190, partial [Gemmatimonadales bacterium]
LPRNSMNPRIALTAAAACILAAPAAIQAQTCTGTASFSAGSMRLGAAGSFTDGAKTYSGTFAVGATQGLFASATAAQISYDSQGGTSTEFGVSAGYSIGLGSSAEFCPILSYAHTAFPNATFAGATITSDENDFSFGGSLGVATVATPSVTFKPFVSAQYFHSTVSEHSTVLGPADMNYDYGLLGVGVGVIVNKCVTILPGIAQPVGLKGAKIAYNIGVAVNFGHLGAAAMRTH